MTKYYPSYDDVEKAREYLRQISYQHWVNDDFLTWKWWLLLVLTIIPWFILYKIVDKKRLTEILLYGLLVSVFAIALDNIGTELLWWGYPDKLFQMVPPLVPADFTLVSCFMMPIYQWCRNWKMFLTFNFLLSLVLTFNINSVTYRKNLKKIVTPFANG